MINNEIKKLREQGYSYAWIASMLGVSYSKVARTLNPAGTARTEKKRRAKKKEWENTNYRGECYCGKPTGRRGRTRCRECEYKERADQHALVLDTVQAMYEEGWTMREMSSAFGHKTVNGVSPWLDDLRKTGRIGYRRKEYSHD